MTPKTRRTVLIATVAIVVIAIVTLLVFRPATAPAPQTSIPNSSTVSTAVVSGLISPQDFTAVYVDGGAAHQLIDVRTPEEFASGHLPNAVNIPLDELPNRLGEVATDEPVVLYCRSGNRSGQAAQLLASEGYTQVLDLGGIVAWQAAGLPVVQ
ncbi:MAG: rhodanese-like domain-containing protein [Anaerolineae bacterium]